MARHGIHYCTFAHEYFMFRPPTRISISNNCISSRVCVYATPDNHAVLLVATRTGNKHAIKTSTSLVWVSARDIYELAATHLLCGSSSRARAILTSTPRLRYYD